VGTTTPCSRSSASTGAVPALAPNGSGEGFTFGSLEGRRAGATCSRRTSALGVLANCLIWGAPKDHEFPWVSRHCLLFKTSMPKRFIWKGPTATMVSMGSSSPGSHNVTGVMGTVWVFPKAFKTIRCLDRTEIPHRSTWTLLSAVICAPVSTKVTSLLFGPTATVINKSPLLLQVSCLTNIHPPPPPSPWGSGGFNFPPSSSLFRSPPQIHQGWGTRTWRKSDFLPWPSLHKLS